MGHYTKNTRPIIHASEGEPPGYVQVREFSIKLHCGSVSVDTESPKFPLTSLRDFLDAADAGSTAFAAWWSSNAPTWWGSLTSLATPTADSGPWQERVLEVAQEFSDSVA